MYGPLNFKFVEDTLPRNADMTTPCCSVVSKKIRILDFKFQESFFHLTPFRYKYIEVLISSKQQDISFCRGVFEALPLLGRFAA